jgi:hypothetical protein
MTEAAVPKVVEDGVTARAAVEEDRSGGSGDRKPKGVKWPSAVTSKKWTPGSQILHRKTRSVKTPQNKNCQL